MKSNRPPGAAIVTGASRGLGAGIADSLARAGRPVVLAARNKKQLDSTASAIAAGGHEVLPVAADVSDELQVQRLIGLACERFGGVDLVVNNAGAVPVVRPLDELRWEDWRRGIDVDVRGAFNTTRAVLAVMRAQGRGTIVTLGAAAGGTVSTPLHAGVSPAQAALVSLMRCVRAWVEPDGLTVHLLYPQITTAGEVGLAGATAFGAQDGVSADEWIRRRFPDQASVPDAVGAAVVALTHEADGGEWTIGPDGLTARVR